MFFVSETLCIDEVEYEIDISLLQIELTTKCNYSCQHCREGNGNENIDINLSCITKTIDFIRKFNKNFSQITLSGGEPFLYKDFFKVLDILKMKKIKTVCVTTNGSFLNKKILEKIKEYNFEKFIFSISIEDTNEEKFNNFRGNINAYKNTVNALELIQKENNKQLLSSLRVSLSKEKFLLSKLENFITFALKYQCSIIKLTPILPLGKAKVTNCYINDPETLKKLSDNYNYLRNKYNSLIKIETNDPLINSRSIKNKDEYTISGCGAGVGSLNLMSNGDLTPCSLLPNVTLCNVLNCSVDDIVKLYKNSEIIKKFITRDYIGKCGKCSYKFQCGGCRARALELNFDLMGSDILCFQK